MKTLAQNDNTHDIYIDSNGLLATAVDKVACSHIIADAIRTLEGELQLDLDAGIPYERTVWQSVGGIPLWKHYVTTRVKAFPFVDEIISLETNLVGREMSYTLTVVIDGETVVVEQ